MPISCVRWATLKEITPYIPMAASKSAIAPKVASRSTEKRALVIEVETIVARVLMFASGRSRSREEIVPRALAAMDAGFWTVRKTTSMVSSEGQTFWVYGTYISGGGD